MILIVLIIVLSMKIYENIDITKNAVNNNTMTTSQEPDNLPDIDNNTNEDIVKSTEKNNSSTSHNNRNDNGKL